MRTAQGRDSTRKGTWGRESEDSTRKGRWGGRVRTAQGRADGEGE